MGTASGLAIVKKSRIKEQIFDQLRDQIVRGAWKPGSKIPSENVLTRQLGVNRVALREALQSLASLGLLGSRQGGGTFVREYSAEIHFNPLFPMIALDRTDVLNVLEYRRILDAIKAGNAARAESLMEEHIVKTIRQLCAAERTRHG